MTIINQNTVVVFSSQELKSALETDNGYTYIFFGSNITLSSGIGISAAKSEVTIDGTYNETMYEFTDQKKLGASDGIYLTSPKTLKVNVKNMNITGYNYYGVVYVPEATAYKDTTIEYSKINYTGPQISYNPVGLTRFLDSYITIKENYASGNEVAECNRIEIGGITTIIHNSTGNSAFWFRNATPSFTILRDSKVYFTSTSRELFYGVTNLIFTISKNSYFSVNTYNGLAYGTNGTGTTIIDESATFIINKTNYSGGYATWYSYGTITVNKSASLTIINNYPNITSSNYNIYFMGSGSGMILNYPEKIVLYNSVANAINTQNSATFNFYYSRINLFNTTVPILDNISKNTLPTYSWYKESGFSNISGTFTSSATVIQSNNYTEEELATLPSLNNFVLANKKIISIGTFPFSINGLTDKDTTMTGITLPYASVLIEYDNINSVVVADEEGNFTYSYTDPLPIGTKITLNSKYYENVLYYTKNIEIVYSGELIIESATKYFQFNLSPISKNPILCPTTELSVTIIDSRVNSSDWKLYASINHQLESKDGDILKDSLVFLDTSGNINVLSTVPTLVYTGKNNGGTISTTVVEWNENEGILLQLIDPLQNNVHYDAEIIWTIEE